MNNKFEEFYSKRQITVKIVWGAITMSIAMLGAILFITVPEPMVLDSAVFINNADPKLPLFALIAIILPLVSWKVFEAMNALAAKKRWDRTEFLSELENSRSEKGVKTYSVDDISFLSTVDDNSLRMYRNSLKLSTAYIVRFALTEAIAILGFLLANEQRNIALFVPFGAFALVMMVLAFPKSELKHGPI